MIENTLQDTCGDIAPLISKDVFIRITVYNLEASMKR